MFLLLKAHGILQHNVVLSKNLILEAALLKKMDKKENCF